MAENNSRAQITKSKIKHWLHMQHYLVIVTIDLCCLDSSPQLDDRQDLWKTDRYLKQILRVIIIICGKAHKT